MEETCFKLPSLESSFFISVIKSLTELLLTLYGRNVSVLYEDPVRTALQTLSASVTQNQSVNVVEIQEHTKPIYAPC
jgi:hypothetical protein